MLCNSQSICSINLKSKCSGWIFAVLCNGKSQWTEHSGHPSGSRAESNCPELKMLPFTVKLTNSYAKYNIPQCISGIENLLIDTGADLNLILNLLQDDVQVSDAKIYKMEGIIDQLVNTRGSTMFAVLMDDKTYLTEFQVV